MAENINFDSYQQQAKDLAFYPNIGHNLTYPVLGLIGEAGEVANKLKKVFRDNGGMIDVEKRDAIVKEVGDVLWYVAMVLDELGVKMSDCAQGNVDSLTDRKSRGKMGGSGDNR